MVKVSDFQSLYWSKKYYLVPASNLPWLSVCDPQKRDLRVVFCRNFFPGSVLGKQRRCGSDRAFYIIVIIGYAGSGWAVGLVPSGRVICADGGFGIARRGCEFSVKCMLQ